MSRRLVNPTTLVVAVIVLGFGLRVFRLDAQSLWYDEAFTAESAEGAPSRIFAGDFGDNHPPFHAIALHCWGLIGQSDFLLRFFSALMGTLGIAAIYTLGRLIFDYRVGLLAAAIAGMAPYQVYYSQEVRGYSTLFLATIILLISYLRAVATNSRRWWMAFACSAIWGMYVHYWIVFVLLGLHLHLLLDYPGRKTAWPKLALVDLSVILAFTPWLNVFVTRVETVARGEFWPTTPGLERLLTAPHAFTLFLLVTKKLVPVALVVVFLLFTVTHLQIARELARRGKDRTRLTFLLLGFWGPVLLTFIISQWRSVYLERTLIVATPALYILLSWGGVRAKERRANLALLFLVAVFALNGLHNWYFNPSFVKPPFRTALRFLQGAIGADEPALHANDASFLTFIHYEPAGEHYLLEGDPMLNMPLEVYGSFGGKSIAREEISRARFWLILYLDSTIEYQMDLAQWFDVHHRLSASYDFDGVSLRHYDDEQSSHR
jgi:hypothetical protein